MASLISLKALAKYAVVFLAAVIISSLFWNISQFLFFRGISHVEDYDYIVYIDGGWVKVKNGGTGQIDFSGRNFSQIMSYLLIKDGLKIFIKEAEYNVSTDIVLRNLKDVKISSNGAKINLNSNFFIIRGDHWENSAFINIEGLKIMNGDLIVENSFMANIKGCTFMDSENGIVLSNTNGWTECTKVEDCYFVNVKRGIVFKTPAKNGTRSYANTEIKRCYFELKRENSVGIHVEPSADFNEGLVQNVRFWMGGVSERNQTGVLVEGGMLNTLLQDVVFESFACSPQNIFGMELGAFCEPPILGQGIVFCGNLTKNIYNPHYKWVYGVGGSFKVENVSIPLGVNNSYGSSQEIGLIAHLFLPVSSFNVKVYVDGQFSPEEIVTVQFRLRFLDDVLSKRLEIVFRNATVTWLDHDDLLTIWPTRNVISSLIVEAKTNEASSNVNVSVSVYGQYG